jgi:hypothetical protein
MSTATRLNLLPVLRNAATLPLCPQMERMTAPEFRHMTLVIATRVTKEPGRLLFCSQRVGQLVYFVSLWRERKDRGSRLLVWFSKWLEEPPSLFLFSVRAAFV